jgi:predicted SprT family Zn-dependent metalloprotease
MSIHDELLTSGKLTRPITIKVKNIDGGHAHYFKDIISIPYRIRSNNYCRYFLKEIKSKLKELDMDKEVTIPEIRRNYVLHEIAHIKAFRDFKAMGHTEKFYEVFQDIGGNPLYDLGYKPRIVTKILMGNSVNT